MFDLYLIIFLIQTVSGELTGFQKECLVAHNKLRALHIGTPALKWSAELTRDAQAWANVLASENKFHHDPDLKELGEGENLAWFSPPNRMCNGPDDEHCSHCGEFVQVIDFLCLVQRFNKRHSIFRCSFTAIENYYPFHTIQP